MEEIDKLKAENLTLKTCLLQAQNACIELRDKYQDAEKRCEGLKERNSWLTDRVKSLDWRDR